MLSSRGTFSFGCSGSLLSQIACYHFQVRPAYPAWPRGLDRSSSIHISVFKSFGLSSIPGHRLAWESCVWIVFPLVWGILTLSDNFQLLVLLPSLRDLTLPDYLSLLELYSLSFSLDCCLRNSLCCWEEHSLDSCARAGGSGPQARSHPFSSERAVWTAETRFHAQGYGPRRGWEIEVLLAWGDRVQNMRLCLRCKSISIFIIQFLYVYSRYMEWTRCDNTLECSSILTLLYPSGGAGAGAASPLLLALCSPRRPRPVWIFITY